MTALSVIDGINRCLRDEGHYLPLNSSMFVGAVPFEFASVLVAGPPAADLVLVVDTTTEGIERVRRRIEAFGRALDSVRSRRPVTTILVGVRPASEVLDALLRFCRVLVVETGGSVLSEPEIRNRLSVLLPLRVSEPVSELANPDEELKKFIEGSTDLKDCAFLLEASHEGSGAVRSALAVWLKQPLITLSEND
jgi:hypothetical protein